MIKSVAASVFVFLLVKSLLFAFLIPPWLGNDEPNHFAYVLKMAGEGDSEAVQKTIVRSLGETGFWEKAEMKRPPADATLFEHTELSQHSESLSSTRPPLYYALAALPVRLFEPDAVTGKLAVARMVSVALSMLSLWFIYLSARAVFEGATRNRFALSAVLLAGLHPQFSYLSAVVNSDVLAVTFFSFVFYRFAVYIRRGFVAVEEIGALLAVVLLAVLTKQQGVALLPVVLLGLALTTDLHSRSDYLRRTATSYALFFALLFVGVLLVEFLSPLNVVKIADRIGISFGYFATGPEALGELSFADYLRGVAVIFVTYWFTYGQMVYKLSFGLYLLYVGLTVAVLYGVAVNVVVMFRLEGASSRHLRSVCFATGFVTVVVAMSAMVFFTPEYIHRASGRYLFYAIAPLSVLTVYGLDGLNRMTGRVDAERLAVHFFLAMNIIALFGYLVPIYHA